MSCVRVVNESRCAVLGANIRMADTLAARLRGFLYRRAPAVGEGLFLAPCRGVHMYGMRYSLDVLFLDQAGYVVASHAGLAPGQRTPVYANSQYAIELPEGMIAASGTAVGDRLSWRPPVVQVNDLPSFVARLREQASRRFATPRKRA